MDSQNAAAPPPHRWVAATVGMTVVSAALAWIVLGPRDLPPTAGAAAPLASSAAAPAAVPPVLGGDTMGGTWSVKLTRLPSSHSREQLESRIAALLDQIDAQLSTCRPQSPHRQFNRQRGTEWFHVPAELAEVVAHALRVSEETGGTFDVTVAPLVDLWGFGPLPTGLREGRVPAPGAIEAAKAHVGHHHLHSRASPPALRKDNPDSCIDLSGIAKGCAAALDAAGVTDYLVSVGGGVRAHGLSHHGRPWHVGIEMPSPDARRLVRQVELRDCAVSTSGDYRDYFEVGGERFSHEIDPRTGRPINHGLASVSVIHPSSVYADAVTKAIMVLGPDDGEKLARRLNLSALLITRGQGHFETRATGGFERLTAGGGQGRGSADVAQ